MLAYADDIVPLAPSWLAMQRLISILEKYSIMLDNHSACWLVWRFLTSLVLWRSRALSRSAGRRPRNAVLRTRRRCWRGSRHRYCLYARDRRQLVSLRLWDRLPTHRRTCSHVQLLWHLAGQHTHLSEWDDDYSFRPHRADAAYCDRRSSV